MHNCINLSNRQKVGRRTSLVRDECNAAASWLLMVSKGGQVQGQVQSVDTLTTYSRDAAKMGVRGTTTIATCTVQQRASAAVKA